MEAEKPPFLSHGLSDTGSTRDRHRQDREMNCMLDEEALLEFAEETVGLVVIILSLIRSFVSL